MRLSILKHQLLVAILSAFHLSPVVGQQLQMVFRHYTTDDGLPSSEVYDIIQDQQGYIWFSTDNGVSRFNGYQFKNYGAREGLNHPVVFYLQEHHDGKIWMATLSGNIYWYEQDSISPFPYNDIVQRYRHGTHQIKQFFVDSSSTVHIALTNLGFLKIDALGQHELIAEELPCGSIFYDLDQTSLNNYVHHESKEVTSIHSYCQTDEIPRGYFPLSFFKDSITTTHLLPHTPGAILNDDGFGFPLNNKLHWLTLAGNAYLFEQQQLIWTGTYPFRANSFLYDEEGGILLGNNRPGGLRIYQNKNAILAGKYESYLLGQTVSHILKDRNNDYWLSTTENGVFYTANRDMKVLNKVSGLTDEDVTAISLKNANEIYLGLRNGAIYYWNVVQQELRQLPQTTTNREVYELAYDSIHHRLWKGSSELHYLQGRKWNPITSIGGERVIRYRANKRFILDYERERLIGCNSGYAGLAVVNLKSGETEPIPKATLGRSFTIFLDQKGKIWVGRQDGIYEFTGDSLLQPTLPTPALRHRIEDIDQLSDGTLVVATKGRGLVLWNEEKVNIIDTRQGLTSDLLEKVHVDEDQNIWVGTLNGLNKISLKKGKKAALSVKTYNLSNGLPSNEVNDISSWGKQVWVATTRGLVKIPVDDANNTGAIRPLIDQLLINNRPREIATQNLAYHENNIRLTFLSLNYRLGDKAKYRYRLQEEAQWTYTEERAVNYSALQAGGYHFEVQTQNEDGIWSSSTSLPFIISPPIWKRTEFYITCVMLISLTVLAFYQRKINQIQKEASIDRQMNKLRQSALRAQMNPHFIFNCLNVVQQASLNGEQLKVAEYLSRFAQLVRLVLDSSLYELVTLSQEVEILEHYLELEKLRLQDRLSYTITIDQKIDLKVISLPPLLVQPYVENAILHGLNQAGKVSKIQVKYIREKAFLKIQVEDNGIGVTASKQRKKSTRSDHQSIGMTLPKKRLDLFDATAQRDRIQVEEMRDEAGQVLGTKVEIRIRWTSLQSLNNDLSRI